MEYQKSETMALCIHNGGFEDDVKMRTVYPVLPDESAARSNYIRIIDETGEDYLYPVQHFVLMDVPQNAKDIFAVLPHSA